MPIWYGAQPAWWAPLERDARRQFGDAVRHSYRRDSLTYELTGLDVIGEHDPIDVRIRFHADPPYLTYGQRPEDFPACTPSPGCRRSIGTSSTTPSASGIRSTRKSGDGRVRKGCWTSSR